MPISKDKMPRQDFTPSNMVIAVMLVMICGGLSMLLCFIIWLIQVGGLS